MRFYTFQARPFKQSQVTILPALEDMAYAQEHRRAGAEVQVPPVEFPGVQWRVVAQYLRRIGVQFDNGVTPVILAVPAPVTGGHENVAGRRIDDRARATPDRRVALFAGSRIHQFVPVAA